MDTRMRQQSFALQVIAIAAQYQPRAFLCSGLNFQVRWSLLSCSCIPADDLWIRIRIKRKTPGVQCRRRIGIEFVQRAALLLACHCRPRVLCYCMYSCWSCLLVPAVVAAAAVACSERRFRFDGPAGPGCCWCSSPATSLPPHFDTALYSSPPLRLLLAGCCRLPLFCWRL